MERLDSLGPLAREAFNYLVPEVGISRVLSAAPGYLIDDFGRWDDARLAAWIKDEQRKRMGGKPFDHFVLERGKGRAHMNAR